MAQRPENVVIHFGKYKGKRLGEILEQDAAYLDFLNGLDDLREPLASAVADINTRCAFEIDDAIAKKEREREHREYRKRGW